LISSRIEKIYQSSPENKNIQSSIKSDELSQATESNSKRSISEYNSQLEDKPNLVIESFSRGTILLIDDSLVASKSAAKILTNLKFEVTMCNSAQTGFDTLKQSPHKFTLVFLDVVMPKVDGVECLSWIKDDPEIAHIPVYMLSGLEDQTLAGIFFLHTILCIITSKLSDFIIIIISYHE
jgi:PleD family two-component response regulator